MLESMSTLSSVCGCISAAAADDQASIENRLPTSEKFRSSSQCVLLLFALLLFKAHHQVDDNSSPVMRLAHLICRRDFVMVNRASHQMMLLHITILRSGFVSYVIILSFLSFHDLKHFAADNVNVTILWLIVVALLAGRAGREWRRDHLPAATINDRPKHAVRRALYIGKFI